MAVSAALLLSCIPLGVFAGDEPRMVVIEAGRVITATGEEYSPGTVVIEDGEVLLVGSRLEYPASADVIEAPNETVMPGLVLAQTRFQLPSYRRSGSKAGLKAASEVYPSEIQFEELIRRGFLYAAFAPAGSGISGQSALYRTTGPDGPELIDDSAYVRIAFTNPGSEKTELSRALANAKKAIENRDKARKEWEKKQEEAKKKAAAEKEKAAKENGGKNAPDKSGDAEKKDDKPAEFKAPPVDPNLQPFMDRLEGKDGPGLIFELRNATGFLHLDDVLKDYEKIGGPLFLSSGLYVDFPEVLEELAEGKPITVIPPVLARRPHTVNLFNFARELVDAGCELAFRPSSDASSSLDRYLAQVGNLVRDGLKREDAIAAVTSGPAKVVGLGDTVGAIAKGKRADLIFLDGDPLRTGSKVTRAMVGGEIVWEEKE